MESTSLDDFKIEKVIGKGSFGFVYLVTRKKDNKIYALKSVILEKLSEKQQESSVNEVRILASVNHPNVIGYKEAFWDEKSNSLNIVMEYADDGDLQTKINKMKNENGFFNESLIWYYSIQMIQGLKALHDKKIMHRDLKSANIFLIKYKHQCKIGDMNVSKVLKDKLLRTQTGTPYYASPEVWRDKPYSYKSDLWSIGCIIYELCQLKTPFTGNDIDELFINVCRGKIERINKVYSDDLWNMINLLLQVDVEKRVDCDQFLRNEIIKKKIEEIKKNENFNIIETDNKLLYDEGELLDTIKFNDINDIKKRLPNKKNYDVSTMESYNKNLSNIFIESKNENKNNSSNLKMTDNNNINEEKVENKNKILIKEIRKELEYMKLKEEIRKKEKKENLEKKIKNENNNKEKNIIKERIKQCERKLKEEKTKNIIEQQNKNYKKNKIIIPFNFNKKIRYVKRRQINDLNKNNSLLSMLSKTSKNSVKINNNNYRNHSNHNQNSLRNNNNSNNKKNHNYKKNNNIVSKYYSPSPSCINKKSQSLSNVRYVNHSTKPIDIRDHKSSMLTINTNKLNINNKSSMNICEKNINRDNIINFITSMNSIDNYVNDNKKYSLNISNIKNSNINCEYNNKFQPLKNNGVSSTPDLGGTSAISRLINHKKKDFIKYDININFNFIPNNFQRYVNNNRYQGENLKSISNKNYSNIESSININNNNINLLSKHKSHNNFNKISIDNYNNYYSNKDSFNNIKLNIPIKTLAQRKLTETNIEKNLKKIKSELNRNIIGSLEKYELNKPETIAYDLGYNNCSNLNDNILIMKGKNKYVKEFNGYGIMEKKNSFLHKVKKEAINQLLNGVKSNRTNNKYYKYNVQNYLIPKQKESSYSLKDYNEYNCYNYINIPIKNNNFFRK